MCVLQEGGVGGGGGRAGRQCSVRGGSGVNWRGGSGEGVIWVSGC